VGGRESRVKDCLQQSKIYIPVLKFIQKEIKEKREGKILGCKGFGLKR
jgi:hypothetical protein